MNNILRWPPKDGIFLFPIDFSIGEECMSINLEGGKVESKKRGISNIDKDRSV